MPFTPRLVLVTVPDVDNGRDIARSVVEKRLAACVNLITGVESHYWWEGKLDTSSEVMLIIKSSAEQFEALAGYIRKHHPHECPEIVAIAAHEISPVYRSWWDETMMQAEEPS
jgi:periplasmic divalent cation tolerance protein